MTYAELDIAPRRLRGRQAQHVELTFERELTAADLSLLASDRGIKQPLIKELRERHHALARCLGQGMSRADASAVTGYSITRISILTDDPTFKELLAHYGQVKEAAFAGFQDRASQVALTALDVIAERLEDEPENIPTGQALEIAKTLADRTGHAPVNRIQQTNVNVDMTARLTAARQRVQALQLDTVATLDIPLEILPDPGGG